MAKRTAISSDDELISVNDVQHQVIDIPGTSKRVALILLLDLKLKTTGPVTGEEYVFDGAGSVVMVNEADADRMLLRQQGPSCCGSTPSKYFSLVGG